ncbi:MAG: zinc ribbon domain-containing protein [Lachnospiraceae bacterium]|nr:zinc ribbon domain-containing protein [Lachnospiraceae bacterium]
MKCNICGADNPNDSRFCSGCGTAINANNNGFQTNIEYQNSNNINNFGMYQNANGIQNFGMPMQNNGQFFANQQIVKLSKNEFVTEKCKVYKIFMIIELIVSVFASLFTLYSVVLARGNYFGLIDFALILLLGVIIFLTNSRIVSLIYFGYSVFAVIYPYWVDKVVEVQYVIALCASILCILISFLIGFAWKKYSKNINRG